MSIPDFFDNWYVGVVSLSRKREWKFVNERLAEQYLRKEYGDEGLCMSIFKYPCDNPSKESIEYAHLFFDFDDKIPQNAQNDAIKLVNFLIGTLRVPETDIQVYFSGNKGYHVIVNASIFGIQPMPYLRRVYKMIAAYLQAHLDLKTLDLSIYNYARMFRLNNTINEKSKKYKISVPTLILASQTSAYILGRADRPDGLGSVKPFIYSEVPLALPHSFYNKFLQKYLESPFRGPTTRVNDQIEQIPQDLLKKLPTGLPVCIKDVFHRFIFSGIRYEAQVHIINFMRDAGYSISEIQEILEGTIREHYRDKPEHQIDQSVINMRSAVEYIYNNGYTFKCNQVLSLKRYENGHVLRVNCSRKACPLYEHCGDKSKVRVNLGKAPKKQPINQKEINYV